MLSILNIENTAQSKKPSHLHISGAIVLYFNAQTQSKHIWITKKSNPDEQL